MPIPLSQLSTWSNQGGTTSAQQTHLSIRGLLENKYTGINTYLQGSYRNSTNIYGSTGCIKIFANENCLVSTYL